MSDVVTDGLLAAALAKLQARLPRIAKSETAKVTGETKAGKAISYSYTYADLAGISAAVMPLLGELELAFIAKPTYVGERFVLAYSLLHSSGEREDGEYPLPQTGTPQAIGSAITYARRYCLCAVTGVAPEDDDDDAAAAQAQASQFRQQQPAPGVPPDVVDGRERVKASWSVSFGWGDQAAGECAAYYERWPAHKATTLWDADPSELRRYAAFLASLPPAVAGEDPANVSAGTSEQVVNQEGELVNSPRPMQAKDRAHIFVLFKELRLTSKRDQLDTLGGIVGRELESRGELTEPESLLVIDVLEARKTAAKSSSGAGEHAEDGRQPGPDGTDPTGEATAADTSPRSGEPAPDDPTTEGD